MFLMFSLGLEFSLPRLLAMRKLVLGWQGADLPAWLARWCLSLPGAGGVRHPGALSTAVVIKQLGEQNSSIPGEPSSG